MPQQPTFNQQFQRRAESPSTLGTVLDWLGRPSRAVAGFVRGLQTDENPFYSAWDDLTGNAKDSWDENLGRWGMDSGWLRTGLGFAGDMVLDPLNLVGGAAVKGAGKGAKLLSGIVGKTGAGALIGAGIGAAANDDDRIKGALIGGFGGAALANPLTRELGAVAAHGAKKLFVPYYDIGPDAYATARRQFDVRKSQIDQLFKEEAFKANQGLTPQHFENIPHLLEAGAKSTDPIEEAGRQWWEKQLSDIYDREQVAGLHRPNTKKDFYTPYVFPSKPGSFIDRVFSQGGVRAKNAFTKPRQLPDISTAIQHGADPSILSAGFTRVVKGKQSAADAEFIRDTLSKFGIDKANAPAEWKSFGSSNMIGTKPMWEQSVVLPNGQSVRLADVYIDPRTMKDLKGLLKVGDKNPLLEDYDKFSNAFRGMATVYKPSLSFPLTNFQGNVWNSILGGMNPINAAGALKDAAMRIAGQPTKIRGVGQLSPQAVETAIKELGIRNPMTTTIGELNPQRLTEEFKNYFTPTSKILKDYGKRVAVPSGIGAALGGAIGATDDDHPLKGALGGALAGALSGAVLGSPKESLNLYKQGQRTINQSIEEASKTRFFVDKLEKYKSLPPDQQIWKAYEDTAKYLFNYQELTPFERDVMRRLVPFYTFTRKNVPLQIRAVADHPAVLASYEKGKTALENLAEQRGQSEPEGFRPEWMQEQQVVGIPNLPEWLAGKAVPGARQFFNPYLPVNDLNKVPFIGGSPVGESGKEWFSGLNPLIKAAIEPTINQSFFTERPLWDEQLGGMGDYQASPFPFNLVPQSLTPYIPGTSTVQTARGPQVQTPAAINYIYNTLFPLASSVGRTADAALGNEATSQRLNTLNPLGLRFMERDPQQILTDRRNAIRNVKSTITKQNKQRNTQGNFNFTDALLRAIRGR